MNVRAPFVSDDEAPPLGSYSMALRDVFLKTAISDPYFAAYMPHLTEALPIQREDLPLLGCYLDEETSSPDGELSAGPFKFVVNVRLSWLIAIAESDKEKAERDLENAYVVLQRAIFTNPYVTSFGDTTDYDTGEGTVMNTRLEGVPRQSARTRWGAFLLNNETPFAHKRWDMTLQYRRVFYPRIIHDLEEIVITTSFPVFRTEDERERIQQVRQQLILNPQPPTP